MVTPGCVAIKAINLSFARAFLRAWQSKITHTTGRLQDVWVRKTASLRIPSAFVVRRITGPFGFRILTFRNQIQPSSTLPVPKMLTNWWRSPTRAEGKTEGTRREAIGKTRNERRPLRTVSSPLLRGKPKVNLRTKGTHHRLHMTWWSIVREHGSGYTTRMRKQRGRLLADEQLWHQLRHTECHH